MYGHYFIAGFFQGEINVAYSTIELTKEGPAAILRFNRPEKRNAINFEMMHEIEDALANLNEDAEVRGIIFTGGDQFFSAGMDLNAAKDLGSPRKFNDFMNHWRRLNKAQEENSKPTIAAIEGFCLTGGLELALACDLRVASENATFAITSARIGTVAGAGGTQRLPRIVGVSNALEMLFAADPFDAEYALRTGLINKKVRNGGALAESKKMVDLYSTRAPLSLRFVKRAVYGGMQMPLSEAIEFEAFIVNTIYNSDDKLEGISAFLEKRPAQFRGE
jgi:enoyl-CoA hydratase/carnithine racemase